MPAIANHLISGQKQIEVEQEKAGRNQGSANVQQNGASVGSLGGGLGALLGVGA